MVKRLQTKPSLWSIPQFYHFDSPKVRERILYANFLQVNQDVKDMIKEIPEFNKK